MSTLLQEVCGIAGIKRVIWVDDLFASNVELLVQEIVIKIPALLKAGHTLEAPALASESWNLDAGPETFSKQINAIVGADKALAVSILASLTAQQQREDPETPSLPADLSGAQVELIKGAFTQVDTFSFLSWQQSKEGILATADDSMLFLVDRDFSYEITAGRDKGDEILKELLTRPNLQGAFILLSHSFVQEQELGERDIFSSRNDCHAGFAFISKERLTRNASDVVEQNTMLASAVQDALIRSWCHRAAVIAGDVVATAVKTAHREMLNQTFDDLGGGIFHLSQRDGVLETETMARLFMLAGRIALQDEMLKPSSLHSRLDSLRKITKAIQYTPTAGKKLSPKLNEWRSREVWDPAAVVNSSYAQPSCGDVYVTTHGKERMFLLLGQPCNLAVRSTSQRNDSEALFAECDLEASHSSYPLDWDGTVRYAKFDYVFPVNLCVLDAVSSTDSGAVRLSFNQALPAGLLPGMALRVGNMARSLAGIHDTVIPYKYRTLSVSEELKKYEPKLDKATGVYAVPLKRIGRLRSPYGDAAFGALANYHTRKAFDFDFSKIPASPATSR